MWVRLNRKDGAVTGNVDSELIKPIGNVTKLNMFHVQQINALKQYFSDRKLFLKAPWQQRSCRGRKKFKQSERNCRFRPERENLPTWNNPTRSPARHKTGSETQTTPAASPQTSGVLRCGRCMVRCMVRCGQVWPGVWSGVW